MSIGKSFFIAYARDLKDARPPAEAEQLVAVWAHCVTIAANRFEIQHGNFNRAKFYEAAGMSDRQ